MDWRHAGPMARKVLANEPAVAPVGRRLATQQDRGRLEVGCAQRVLDVSVRHESQEATLERRPVTLASLVRVEEFPRGGEAQVVLVSRPHKLREKELEIPRLGESRKLGRVVQANVEQSPDAGVLQPAEEVLSRRLRETDRVDLHVSILSSNSLG